MDASVNALGLESACAATDVPRHVERLFAPSTTHRANAGSAINPNQNNWTPELGECLGALGYLVCFLLQVGSLVHDAVSLAVVQCFFLNVAALTHLRHFFTAERAFHDEDTAIDQLAIIALFI